MNTTKTFLMFAQLILASAALFFASCHEPQFGPTPFACQVSPNCPAGYTCQSGVCRNNNNNPDCVISVVPPSSISPRYIVSALQRDDSSADGKCQPYGSITKALKQPLNPGDIIWIAPGTYSVENTHEEFPLVLPAGIKLLGDISERGGQFASAYTEITGDGQLNNESHKITIVAANDNQISGLRIRPLSNNSYGIFTSGTFNLISSNTFLGANSGIFQPVMATGGQIIRENNFLNNYYGISSNCSGAPTTIEDNEFTSPSYGMLLASSDIVRRNTFAQNQLAIDVRGNSPLLENNICPANLCVFAQNSSSPKLRGNTFSNNQEAAVRLTGNADLGMNETTDPGNNKFNNCAVHISLTGSAGIVYARGNSFSPSPACKANLSVTAGSTGKIIYGPGDNDFCISP